MNTVAIRLDCDVRNAVSVMGVSDMVVVKRQLLIAAYAAIRAVAYTGEVFAHFGQYSIEELTSDLQQFDARELARVRKAVVELCEREMNSARTRAWTCFVDTGVAMGTRKRRFLTHVRSYLVWRALVQTLRVRRCYDAVYLDGCSREVAEVKALRLSSQER